jgi:UDP-N-acetylglucosamine 2-epimerase
VQVCEDTERPVTVSMGTNVLVGRDPDKLRLELSRVLKGQAKKGTIPPLWDGHAGERIAALAGCGKTSRYRHYFSSATLSKVCLAECSG